MNISELAGKRVVLLGLGADVLAAVPSISDAGPAEMAVVDDGPAATTTDLRVMSLEEAGEWADVFVRSPGFPRYREPLVAALERGAAMTTPTDLWIGTFGADRTIVAITGTKGKSTVTALLGTLAERGRIDAGVAGNLGVPVFSDSWNHEAPVVILELSSYQAADLHHAPDIAIVTYLSEDHLSWHGGVERYEADKLRVVRNEGGTAGRVIVAEAGGRASEVIRSMGIEHSVIPSPVADPSVPVHRLQNAALAAAALEALDGHKLVDVEIIALARHAMPGRLDPCPGPPGMLCVDDALASNPSATAAALAWLRALERPTVVLLGGIDRYVDPTPLREEVARWEPGMLRAVILPDNGSHLASAIRIEVAGIGSDMTGATNLAIDAVPTDGVVLFSPAAPTPPDVGTWETRSEQFRAAAAAAANPAEG